MGRMTLYDLLAKSKPMQKNKADMINVCAKQLKRPTHEIKAELDNLMQQGKIKCTQGQYYTCTIVPREKSTFQPPTPEQATPLAYDIYNYMKILHVGEDNAIHMEELAKHFDISARKLREVVSKINEGIYTLKNGNTFKRKIYGSNKGYYIVSNDRERNKHLRSIDIEFYNIIRKRNKIRADYGLDNQTKLALSDWESELVKSISSDL